MAGRSEAVFRRGIWQLAGSRRDALPDQRRHAVGDKHGAGAAKPRESRMDIVSSSRRIAARSTLEIGPCERQEVGSNPDAA